MQRIKSQSVCYTTSTALLEARPRSKKAAKAPGHCTSSQYPLSRPKQYPASGIENSMVSMKSNPKLGTSSIKNIKVGSSQQPSCKNSVPTSSRMMNNHSSAVSARILKEIVGYSQRGVKNKENRGHHNGEAARLEIDLDHEIANLCLHEPEPDARSSKCRAHSSLRGSAQKYSAEGLEENHKRAQQPTKMNRKSDRVTMQFSPLCEKTISRNSENYMELEKKKNRSVFLAQTKNTESQKITSDSNIVVTQYLSQEELAGGCEQSLSVVSPRIGRLLDTSDNAPAFNGQFGHNRSSPQRKFYQQGGRATPAQEITSNEQKVEQLLRQKEVMTMSLEQATSLLNEHFQLKYKELIPAWNNIIQLEQSRKKTQQQVIELKAKLQKLQAIDMCKKTQLFEVNREQVCAKKEKEYASRRNRQKNIAQAVSIHEQLRHRFTSKVDFQHIIVFNLKVVLSGKAPIDDLEGVFTEMFQSRLSKKFALIAKKQAAHLSVYDSRQVQDYFRRLQELQSGFIRAEAATQKNLQSTAHYITNGGCGRLEQLVEEIQDLAIRIGNLKSDCSQKQEGLLQMQEQLAQNHGLIDQYVGRTSQNISLEYKMLEGHSFDFEAMLEQNLQIQFQNYKKAVASLKNYLTKIEDLEHQIVRLAKVDQRMKYQQERMLNNQQQRSSANTLRQSQEYESASQPTDRIQNSG